MADFYPFIDPQLVRESDIPRVPLAKEYAYDMSKATFKLKNGRQYFVYENEAIKVKLWKLFMTERYRWVVFPWSYGQELETLIGKAYTQGYVNSEAERYCKEAIERALGEYIERIEDLKIEFQDSTLKIDFTAITVYGKLEISGMPIDRRWE